jgi:hypothetical protein
MLPADHRWVYYYDFELQSYPKGAPSFELYKVLKQVENVWMKGDAVQQYENGDLTIRVKDMRFIEDYIAVLINVSDISATDPAFSNVLTGDVRKEEKRENEGIGASCHVLFRKESIRPKSSSYLALIEEVIGIPKSTIEKFLTSLFRNHCKSSYKNPGKNPEKELVCRPKAVFSGHGSETLKTSLKEGELQGVILLNHKDTGYIDDDKQLRKIENVMRVRAVGKPKGNFAIDVINKAKDYARQHDFDEVRVQFKEVIDEKTIKTDKGVIKKKEVTKQRTVKFETKEQDFANLIFTKSELIKLKEVIGQCEETIHRELSNKMKDQLNKLKK